MVIVKGKAAGWGRGLSEGAWMVSVAAFSNTLIHGFAVTITVVLMLARHPTSMAVSKHKIAALSLPDAD